MESDREDRGFECECAMHAALAALIEATDEFHESEADLGRQVAKLERKLVVQRRELALRTETLRSVFACLDVMAVYYVSFDDVEGQVERRAAVERLTELRAKWGEVL
jgi:hypothetical protein